MAKRSPTRGSAKLPTDGDAKSVELRAHIEESPGTILTSNQGVPINDDHQSLKAGERGPTLLEDFLLREKITHFDHERIPERVVHARGGEAPGFFELDKPLTKH